MFHVQTEDSGIRHPHLITHLFADGGRILKSTKTSYAEHVGRPEMVETVRNMMQEQHKGMIIALRNGEYDYIFDKGAQSPPAAPSQKQAISPATPPPPATPPSSTPAAPAAAAAAAPAPPAPAPAATAAPALAAPAPSAAASPAAASPSATPPPIPLVPAAMPPIPPVPAAMPPIPALPFAPVQAANAEASPPHKPSPLDLARRPPSTAEQRAVVFGPPPQATSPAPEEATKPASRRSGMPRPTLQISTDALHVRDSSTSAPQVTLSNDMPARPPHKSIDLDVDALNALERAAVEVQTPFYQQINDLPPPPAALLNRRPPLGGVAGGYAISTPGSEFTPPPSPLQIPPAATPPPPAPAAQSGAGRYGQARPGLIFDKPPTEGVSLFGEDWISEKSLDEVILSYLAEDLESAGSKK